MSTTDLSWPETIARLNRLERQQRQLRRAALAALCALPLGLGAFALDSPAPVVQAERIELVDAAGQRRALLKADSAAVDLLLFTAKGRVATAMRLSADSTLRILDGTGAVIATMGGPTVKHLVE
jgi:hypothetical protein